MSKALNVLSILFDDGLYNEINSLVNKGEVFCVSGYIGGESAYAFYLDGGAFNFNNCRKIIKLYDLAVKTGSPVIGFYSSKGVDLKEGSCTVNEYSELLNKAFSVSGVVPQISVITGECLGVAAIMSNTADIVIGISGNDYYLTANSENKTDDSLKNGVVDIISKNAEEAAAAAAKLISLLPQNNLSAQGTVEYTESDSFVDADSFIELKSEYTDTVITGLATSGGIPVGIIDYKGNALGVRAAYKAEQLIKLCNAYSIPIITVADSTGFDNDEQSVLITALTKLSSAYANATTAKISVITKELTGGALVTLAGKGSNADVTVALKGSVISPMNISSAVAFMYDERLSDGEDRAKLENEYRQNEASAESAAKSGTVDIITERNELRKTVIDLLMMLSSKRETTIPRKHTVK